MHREPGTKVVDKHFRPKWTCWKASTVTLFKQLHKRRARRIYRQYLATGSDRLLTASLRRMNTSSFD